MFFLALYLSLSLSLFLVPDIRYQAGLAGAVTIGLAAIPFRKTRAGVVPIALLLVFTFIGNLLFHPGRILWASGVFSITAEGLSSAGIRVLRLYAMIYGAKILTAALPLEELLASAGRLLGPLERVGIPVKDFFSVMALTVKVFPPLTKRFLEALRASQAEPAAGLRQRAAVLAGFMVPFFTESLRCPERFFEDSGPGA
jgi:energy-coupling factor transport system permease protein